MPLSTTNPPVELLARPLNIGTWPSVAVATAGGTDTACTSGTVYVASIYIPGTCFVNGIQYLIGSVGGTDKVIATLHDIGGNLLASSAIAGATVGTAANNQQVPITLTGSTAATLVASSGYQIIGPTYLYIGLTFNGTTAKFRTIPAQCQSGSGVSAGSGTQTFGTPAAFTPSATSFTAATGPIASLY